MSKIMKSWLAAAIFAAALVWAPLAHATGAYNAIGTCQRPTGGVTYTSNQLFGCQIGGSLAPAPITIGGVSQGAQLITGARLFTTGTGASGAAYKVFLYSTVPTITGLSDASAYTGPYAADLSSNIYIGQLTCSTMTPTNDSTHEYWSECSIGNLVSNALQFIGAPGGTIQAMISVTTGYTALTQEEITIEMSTIPAQ